MKKNWFNIFLLFNMFSSYVFAEEISVVLYPVQVDASESKFVDYYSNALQEGLQQRYKVYYGPAVEKFLQKEYQKINCNAETCAQNVAIEFNTPLIVDVSVVKTDEGYLLSLTITNVLTNEIIESQTMPCKKCGNFQVVEQLKILGIGQIAVAKAEEAKAKAEADRIAALTTASNTNSTKAIEKRQGIVLDFGIGLHNTNFDINNTNQAKTLSESESGWVTTWKLGKVITPQLSLYYAGNLSAFKEPNNPTVTYSILAHGLGISYFLSQSAPSAYFLLVGGKGKLSAGGDDPHTGNVFMLGGGYEFGNHLTLEVAIAKANLESQAKKTESVKTSALQFTLNYFFSFKK